MADEECCRISEEESNQLEAASKAVKQRRKPIPVGSGKMEHRHRAQSIIHAKALDELETEVETGLYENVDLERGSRWSVIAAEITFNYLWWSVLYGLAPLMWFFPLCAMEISGYEAVSLLWFSPVVTLVGPIRRGISTPIGLLLLRLLMLVGVASFQSPTSLSRLVVLAVGNMFAMLSLCGLWWDISKLDRHRHIYLLMLGYLFYQAVRVWGASFNYIFMGYTYNFVATIAGVFLALFLYINDWRTPILSQKEPGKPSAPGDAKYPGLVATGVGFGGILFFTQLMFGDLSVISRWAVDTYPDRGPYPNPWSFLTMLSLTVGLVVFGHQRDLQTSPAWTVVGLLSALGLYFLTSYTAFFCGCILAVYTMSLWPLLSKRVSNFQAGKVLFFTSLTFIFLFLLSVWVVAYNFVPGGTITRERTDAMLIIIVLMIGAASRTIQHRKKNKNKTPDRRAHHTRSETLRKRRLSQAGNQVMFLGRVFRRLSTVSEESEEEEDNDWLAGVCGSGRGSETHQARARELFVKGEEVGRQFHHRVLRVSLVIVFIALLGFAYRYHPDPAMPQREHPRVFSAGIWAFHFGYDNSAYPSMEQSSQFIRDTDIDVIGLLETDAARPYIGSRDIASWLAERLDMYVDYGPGTDKHTWGAIVLSKYPIVKSEHYLLPSPEGEIAPALMVTVNVSGVLANVYCVHFGNDVDDLDRKLQAQATAEILSNSSHPVVMVSYITNKHGSRDYNTITSGGGVKDIDPTDRKRFCEYIFYRGLTRIGYARISHGDLSDTELQMGKFQLPEHPGEGEGEGDNDVVTQTPGDVPEWTHFPDRFGALYHGHYRDKSRHHFHMGTPKYFKRA